MPPESTPLLNPPRGTWCAPKTTDVRSPCPLINSLANHGYIARSGQNINASELNAAMSEVGLSTALGAFFARPIFNVHQDAKEVQIRKKMGFFKRLWFLVRNPWAILSVFGMRKWDQNQAGKPVLNLDQLALPGVVEHDVSLTRRDHLQKAGNISKQDDLIKDLLACSSDGKKLTMDDLAKLRKRRIERQLEDNPGLRYGGLQHDIACTEIALVLELLGDGNSVKCSYAQAFFQDERLPEKEGWTKRWWYTLGFWGLISRMSQVKAKVGLKID